MTGLTNRAAMAGDEVILRPSLTPRKPPNFHSEYTWLPCRGCPLHWSRASA